MTDRTKVDHDFESPIDLSIQPTGNGVADMELAKLQAAVDEGVEDPSIVTPLPNDSAID
ncbi:MULTISPECIES: hypothetical protein [unclassified Sphingomonas]|uniref:hypothetical protein n=1 Tax=unclassified Sphingomonas TaxID=196159 RepID=UPI0012E22466|nr:MULTISPECIES: hypothetical protein [unclassified Sphingomonas]